MHWQSLVRWRVLFHNTSAAALPPGGHSNTQSYEVRDSIEFRRKRTWCAAQKTSARIGKAAAPVSYYTQLATEGYIIVSSMLRGRKNVPYHMPQCVSHSSVSSLLEFLLFWWLSACCFLKWNPRTKLTLHPHDSHDPPRQPQQGSFWPGKRERKDA